ncbi:hypothetical protein BDP27DRAFT_1317925 [Rhodocollybia butyracea]|uniref:Uncharacterized protein n=1 Tax=Rhodocollybia butyracea TaxID=206335 RepID=A0A9P5UCE7_9AGAR|nr:hypothetical protein BDP27DRAFT_1317925 [Rhodocollybia butyracea]
MIDVNIVSIAVAVLALLGTVAQAALTGWFSLHSEEKKRQASLRATFSKYHDPLHLAADDLSVKLINIISYGFVHELAEHTYIGPNDDPGVQGYSVKHTSFVFAQFFAWVNILRRDTEFLRPHTASGSAGADVIELLARIRSVLRSGFHPRFQIATGIQSAMGEIATTSDSLDGKGQMRCIGFAAFCEKWATEPAFRTWFDPIVQGVRDLASQPKDVADNRLLILQHLLSDLIDVLDPEHIHSYAKGHCEGRPPRCMCTKCATIIFRAGEQGGFGQELKEPWKQAQVPFPGPFMQVHSTRPSAEQSKLTRPPQLVQSHHPRSASLGEHKKQTVLKTGSFVQSQQLAEQWKSGTSVVPVLRGKPAPPTSTGKAV